jgi:hypothetical protein
MNLFLPHELGNNFVAAIGLDNLKAAKTWDEFIALLRQNNQEMSDMSLRNKRIMDQWTVPLPFKDTMAQVISKSKQNGNKQAKPDHSRMDAGKSEYSAGDSRRSGYDRPERSGGYRPGSSSYSNSGSYSRSGSHGSSDHARVNFLEEGEPGKDDSRHGYDDVHDGNFGTPQDSQSDTDSGADDEDVDTGVGRRPSSVKSMTANEGARVDQFVSPPAKHLFNPRTPSTKQKGACKATFQFGKCNREDCPWSHTQESMQNYWESIKNLVSDSTFLNGLYEVTPKKLPGTRAVVTLLKRDLGDGGAEKAARDPGDY